MGEEKGEAVRDRQGFSVRHGDADIVRARLVGVEPGLDQPILLHSLLSRERKRPIQHAARSTQNMQYDACTRVLVAFSKQAFF